MRLLVLLVAVLALALPAFAGFSNVRGSSNLVSTDSPGPVKSTRPLLSSLSSVDFNTYADLTAAAARREVGEPSVETVSRLIGRPRGRSRSFPREDGGIDFGDVRMAKLKPGNCTGSKCRNLTWVLRTDITSAMPAAINDSFADETYSAMFVWLLMENSTFWVNLNPDEPNRMIDARLGKTDAGKILMEADLLLKKTAGLLLHPDKQLGSLYWNSLYDWIGIRNSRLCYQFRQWIVPGKVSVMETNSTLFVVDAALDVKQESDYFKMLGTDNDQPVPGCEGVEPEIQAQTGVMFQKVIMPYLIAEVNKNPAYKLLRYEYYWRVVAEWLQRERPQVVKQILDQFSLPKFYSTMEYSFEDLWRRYLDSVAHGEFNLRRRVRQGRYIFERTYFHGGVDFYPTLDMEYLRP
eukprot:Rmarinus@m.24763